MTEPNRDHVSQNEISRLMDVATSHPSLPTRMIALNRLRSAGVDPSVVSHLQGLATKDANLPVGP